MVVDCGVGVSVFWDRTMERFFCRGLGFIGSFDRFFVVSAYVLFY